MKMSVLVLRWCRWCWAGALLLCTAVAWADGHGQDHDHERDHDRARRAVQAGELVPLQQVLSRLASQRPGRAIEVELEQEDGRWVYEIKWLQPDGRLLRLEVDGRTGRLLPAQPARPAGRH